MIAFVDTHKAFLPGLYAYTQFFSKYNIPYTIVTASELSYTPCTVEWFFMGADATRPRRGVVKIHEYLSTSTPPFRLLKDLGKAIINTKPHFRIFQNDYVRSSFGFRDGVPYGFRSEGVSPQWLMAKAPEQPKEFDFIYTGDLSTARRPSLLIDRFTNPALQQHSLLLLGRNYAELQKKYEQYSHIIFKGPVSSEQVRSYILQSRFGINYIPNRAPFNRLPSTKFLEHAACNIPVISSDYRWIRNFQQQYGGDYFYLRPDLSNLVWEEVNNFQYASPVLDEWTWEHQIRRSGVLEFLKEKFPEWNFDHEKREGGPEAQAV